MPIEVTQADRDAAARSNGYANWAVWETCPQHSVDHMNLCARDFAAHRLLGKREGMEEAAVIMEGGPYFSRVAAGHLRAAAAITEQLPRTIPAQSAHHLAAVLDRQAQGNASQGEPEPAR